MSFQIPITIAKVIENIQSNQYILPAIQREFIWSDKQIERLFDSLMRGYPIGSFLFWKIKPDNLSDFQFYKFMDRYHQRDYKHNEPINLTGERERVAVLDGQQRLTSLNIGLKGHYASKLPYYHWTSDHAFPKRKLYLNLLIKPDVESDMAYKFKMLKDKDVEEKSDHHYWFPVGQITQFRDIGEVFEFCLNEGLANKGFEHPWKTLQKLWEVINKKQVINYFLEEDDNLDKVLNIFIRVNSGGTQLGYSDILLSVATAHWEKYDARDEIYSLVDELNMKGESFNFNKDFILKASLVLSDIKNVAFKIKNFTRENMLEIQSKWLDMKQALNETVKLLTTWGYSRDTLASNNAVIPIAYYILKKENSYGIASSPSYEEDRKKMRRWLMRALLKQTLGGQADTVLARIRKAIMKNTDSFPEDEIYEELRGTTKSMAFDEDQIDGLLDTRYGNTGTFTVLAYLYPWLKYDQHFHIDHIFPRSMFTHQTLSKNNIPEEDWELWLDHKDDLGNLQLLQGKVNMNKSDKDFEEWLLEQETEPIGLEEYKKRHMIPEMDLSFLNFPEFLEKRTNIIKEKLKEILLYKK
ncbi:MAG: DUF262 domain-containing protein [Candidatus Aminicenantes bacterium]|nr:DUF262 domain-containing protein [Candidatus Aminicenantes bacterium]